MGPATGVVLMTTSFIWSSDGFAGDFVVLTDAAAAGRSLSFSGLSPGGASVFWQAPAKQESVNAEARPIRVAMRGRFTAMDITQMNERSAACPNKRSVLSSIRLVGASVVQCAMRLMERRAASVSVIASPRPRHRRSLVTAGLRLIAGKFD